MNTPAQTLTHFLETYLKFIQQQDISCLEQYGTLDRVQGLMIEAHGLCLPIGSCVEICGQHPVIAQVISFSEDSTYLIPFDGIQHLYPASSIKPLYVYPPIPSIEGGDIAIDSRLSPEKTLTYLGKSFPFSPALLGRVINAWGDPLDGKNSLHYRYIQADKASINPLEKKKIQEILDVGIRSINGLLTIAKGQRMGIFAFAGVGKSMLIGMMTQNAKADIIIVALIGERGREVKEFIEDILGEKGLQQAIVIAATADDSALLRVRAAEYANFLAEAYRAQGYDVLLVMDSLTRYAQAQREIALSSGELPAMKGYPTSTYVKIASLIEKAGTGRANEGSITAFYTILMESEEDPIADTAKAILDGHIMLSQTLANSGHYPAIDISQSISRVLNIVHPISYIQKINHIKELWYIYQQSQDMISIGAYSRGSDPQVDLAIQAYPEICNYLRQTIRESCDYTTAQHSLETLANTFSNSISNISIQS